MDIAFVVKYLDLYLAATGCGLNLLRTFGIDWQVGVPELRMLLRCAAARCRPHAGSIVSALQPRVLWQHEESGLRFRIRGGATDPCPADYLDCICVGWPDRIGCVSCWPVPPSSNTAGSCNMGLESRLRVTACRLSWRRAHFGLSGHGADRDCLSSVHIVLDPL